MDEKIRIYSFNDIIDISGNILDLIQYGDYEKNLETILANTNNFIKTRNEISEGDAQKYIKLAQKKFYRCSEIGQAYLIIFLNSIIYNTKELPEEIFKSNRYLFGVLIYNALVDQYSQRIDLKTLWVILKYVEEHNDFKIVPEPYGIKKLMYYYYNYSRNNAILNKDQEKINIYTLKQALCSMINVGHYRDDITTDTIKAISDTLSGYLEMKGKIKKVEEENETLKIELEYQPNGKEMKKLEKDFYINSKKLNNL